MSRAGSSGKGMGVEVPEELARMSGDVSELQDDVSHMKETLTAHEVRLGNGREIMSEMREDLESLKPKAPDWLKILLAGLTVIGVLMGGQLWMTDRFNDRPTRRQVEKMTTPIQQAQKETAKEIKDIEKYQSAQQISIQNIERAQTQQGTKIDKILTRLPEKRSRR